MTKTRRSVAVAAMLVLVAPLVGCSLGSLGSPRRMESPAPSPSSSAHAAPPTPAVSTTPAPRARTVPGERVGPYPVEVPVDLGAREYARGEVDLDENGTPRAYHVAAGDVIDVVTARFGFFSTVETTQAYDYLNTINQVRRGGYPWPLYAGDTLNLSAYTITSVGDIDGVVRNDPAPSPMPEQR